MHLRDLDAEGITYWTRRWRDIVLAVAPMVQPHDKPCAYGPWTAALRDHAKVLYPLATYGLDGPDLHDGLAYFAEEVSSFRWPEEQADLIDFALTFLEADVMLFRSGYAKKNLLRRIKQAPLSAEHIKRVERLIRRAVLHGFGSDEYRNLCKLAGHLVAHGGLRDLPAWLRHTADGAILTLSAVDQHTVLEVFLTDDRDEEEMKLLSQQCWGSGDAWGLVYPQMDQLVPAGKRLKDPQQQVRRNAYFMWRQIERRLIAETGRDGVILL